MRLTRHDIGEIDDFLTKFPGTESFDLVEESCEIGSTLYIEITGEEQGYEVKKKYTIVGVDNW